MRIPTMRAAQVALAALFAIATAMAAGPAQAASPTWPQFGHDAQKTGANPDERTITRSTVGGLQLEYVAFGPTDPRFGGISQSSPAVVGNVAYVGTDGGQLLAWPATGCGSDQCQPIWQAQLANGAFTTPAVAGGLVFIASAGNAENGLGNLYAFRAAGCGQKTCKPVWTAPVPGAGTPTVSDGIVYLEAGDGRLLAFTANGCGKAVCAPLWTGNIKTSALNAAPAVANGLVYATSSERLIAFRAAGCGLKVCPPVWASIPVAGSDTGSGLIQDVGPTVSGDQVYFASVDFQAPDGKASTIYAFGSNSCASTTNLNCQPLWVAHPSDFDGIVANLTVSDGFLYASGVGDVFAFNANGCGRPVCSFLWFGGLGVSSGTFAAPSVAGGVVYYTQNTGLIGGFDAAGCGDLFCSPIFSAVTSQFDGFMTTPVVVNGRLYVAGPAVDQQPTMWVYHLAK